VFEITPKEQLLKNIRKGLVQPLPNKFPQVNLEKAVYKHATLHSDESFVKVWTDKGYYFNVVQGVYDLIHQVRMLCNHFDLGIPMVTETQLKKLMDENGVSYSSPEHPDKTIFCSFSKLEINTNSLYFSSEVQPVIEFPQAENLILFGKASMIDNPDNNKTFSELMIKNDLRVHLPLSYLERFKKVFLLIEES